MSSNNRLPETPPHVHRPHMIQSFSPADPFNLSQFSNPKGTTSPSGQPSSSNLTDASPSPHPGSIRPPQPADLPDLPIPTSTGPVDLRKLYSWNPKTGVFSWPPKGPTAAMVLKEQEERKNEKEVEEKQHEKKMEPTMEKEGLAALSADKGAEKFAERIDMIAFNAQKPPSTAEKPPVDSDVFVKRVRSATIDKVRRATLRRLSVKDNNKKLTEEVSLPKNESGLVQRDDMGFVAKISQNTAGNGKPVDSSDKIGKDETQEMLEDKRKAKKEWVAAASTSQGTSPTTASRTPEQEEKFALWKESVLLKENQVRRDKKHD